MRRCLYCVRCGATEMMKKQIAKSEHPSKNPDSLGSSLQTHATHATQLSSEIIRQQTPHIHSAQHPRGAIAIDTGAIYTPDAGCLRTVSPQDLFVGNLGISGLDLEHVTPLWKTEDSGMLWGCFKFSALRQAPVQPTSTSVVPQDWLTKMEAG